MNHGFRDLAPLRPRAEPARWEAMVAAVEAAAAPELARRASARAPGLAVLLSHWTRRAVPAALAVGVAALAVLTLGEAREAETAPGVSEALGFPRAIASWVEGHEPPSLEEMVLLLEGEVR